MKTKRIAALSLAVMGIGFIATALLPDVWYIRLLQGGFEAGLVGGIADWFAVTALFRHPLGVPIPHTSLLLRNRQKIVNALISALENELLRKESITRKLQEFRLWDKMTAAVTGFVLKRSMRAKLLTVLEAVIRELPADRIAAGAQSLLSERIRAIDPKLLAEKLAGAAVRGGWDERALDYALLYGAEWAGKRETEQMLGRLALGKLSELQLGGFMGFAVQAFAGFMNEEKLGSMLQNLILSGIGELSRPESVYRERLLAEIRSRIERLPEEEALMARVKRWMDEKADGDELGRFLAARLEELREALLRRLEEERRTGGRSILKLYRFVTDKLRERSELTAQWERGLLALIVNAVEANHYRIGLLVRDNLDQLDDRMLVSMFEDKVGNDLQWIRVNGAVCGFIVGIGLTLALMAV
ncbi:DUF445 domain-containing protein [Paenibacillus humicola]|uniref:DUF445 domain-containing protein n=1 Tax=Paenibacillus humicola TaxID=3110540 RepID=UPI00237B17D1|nr:DUF445 domain-containing protein [Paenibacillus humicola]